MNQDHLKQLAAHKALTFIYDKMKLGIGSGSTVAYFIEALKNQLKEKNWQIYASFSSEKSKQLASCQEIIHLDDSLETPLDLYIDGADEIDSNLFMIKGGGKALLREKLVCHSSSNGMIVILDETKLSKKLGNHPLPIEIIPFGYKSTIRRIEDLGLKGSLRRNKEGKMDITDNGNYLFDLTFTSSIDDPIELHHKLKNLLGVVETGLFFHVAKKALVAMNDGSVRVYE